MTTDANSTRRSLLKGAAVLGAPLAVTAPAAALADEQTTARLARLEDEAAIRGLHQTWLRRTNTGAHDEAALLFADPKAAATFDRSLRSIAANPAGEPGAIELAADGRRATGRFACVVELQTVIAPDCTLAQMAHAQGGGFLRYTEPRVLTAEYVKTGGGWSIATIGFAAD